MGRRGSGGHAPAQARGAKVGGRGGPKDQALGLARAGGEIQAAGGDEGRRGHRADDGEHGRGFQRLLKRPQGLGRPRGDHQDQPFMGQAQAQTAPAEGMAVLVQPGLLGHEGQRPRIGLGPGLLQGARQGEGGGRGQVLMAGRRDLLQGLGGRQDLVWQGLEGARWDGGNRHVPNLFSCRLRVKATYSRVVSQFEL